jgi:hypothetical protein
VSESEFVAVLRLVDGRLRDLGLSFMVGGSVASSAYGEPRMTRDVDLVIELTREGIEPLILALGTDFYVSRDAMLEAVRDSRSFNAVHVDSGIKIDFFVRGSAPFDTEEFSRRRPFEIEGQPPLVVPMKSIEDSVLRKLQWFRDGDEASEQQWRDVIGLLALNAPELDRAYLSRWAATIGVKDLLERADRQVEKGR